MQCPGPGGEKRVGVEAQEVGQGVQAIGEANQTEEELPRGQRRMAWEVGVGHLGTKQERHAEDAEGC